MTKKKQDKWTKSSWRSFPAQQQPVWPDKTPKCRKLKNF